MHLPLLFLLLTACISGSSGGVPRRIAQVPGDTSRHPSPEGHECYKQITATIMSSLGSFLDGFKGRTAIVDAALHFNVGDNMLWLGAKRLLNMYGRTADVLCAGSQRDITQPKFPHCPAPGHLLRALGTPALILWSAGGNFGVSGVSLYPREPRAAYSKDLYPGIQAFRDRYMFELDRELRHNPDFAQWNVTLVHLPQSMYYRNKTYMEEDKQLYASFKHLKVHFFSRSKDGVEMWGPGLGVDVKPAPDMVYLLGPQQTIQEPVVDVMLLMRKDYESEFQYDQVEALAKEVFASSGLTYIMDDWPVDEMLLTNHPQGLWADLAEVRTFLGMKMMAQGKLVITNRLHSTLLSSLMGVPVIWYSGHRYSGYDKVGGAIDLAWKSSPACTDDNLRVWQAVPPEGGTEEQAARLAFNQAVEYFKK